MSNPDDESLSLVDRALRETTRSSAWPGGVGTAEPEELAELVETYLTGGLSNAQVAAVLSSKDVSFHNTQAPVLICKAARRLHSLGWRFRAPDGD